MTDTPDPILRDPLARAMIAAWINVPVDQLPASLNAHTCVATMTAWKRVGEAAVAYVRDQAGCDQSFALMEKLSSAISDPGLITDRKRFDDRVELMSHWQARAVVASLPPLPDRSSTGIRE